MMMKTSAPQFYLLPYSPIDVVTEQDRTAGIIFSTPSFYSWGNRGPERQRGWSKVTPPSKDSGDVAPAPALASAPPPAGRFLLAVLGASLPFPSLPLPPLPRQAAAAPGPWFSCLSQKTDYESSSLGFNHPGRPQALTRAMCLFYLPHSKQFQLL